MEKLIRITPKDDVAVCTQEMEAGEKVTIGGTTVTALEKIPFGHKIALRDIKKSENIIKYGFPIGHATEDIKAGSHIHSHNLQTNLEGTLEYKYKPRAAAEEPTKCELAGKTFLGYRRKNGKVGIRNEIWIIPTVGCVNKSAELIAKAANERFAGMCDGIFAYTHPYGCSQLGDDQLYTQHILAGLVEHPNATGVLVLGLGCENNNIDVFKKFIHNIDEDRIKFLSTQDVEDEVEAALKLIRPLAERASAEKRVEIPVEELVIGFKCGGSDAFSGITANPLCGRITDRITSCGGRAILTEVPEMFGAETILMGRSLDEKVFNRVVSMVNGFKEYYQRHNQVVYENPSPGNKAGGITTLEEKSLGCIQKGGSAVVTDVLEYGERCVTKGLNLLTGPGNDMVSCTNMAAAGAHMILFTTGRGTPFGPPVPTIKISTNTGLFEKKPQWIDYNAGKILTGTSFEEAADELFSLILDTASGKYKTKNEKNGYREIAIFKDGVTL
ncbi:Altronate dehydratase [[Clostridium] cellulosi]|uniref:Altronate dehydratase n=1 Tax=[Clostridium] cellulosi TaxID=29343 RepID=A0A078KML1_9FIRM|nr:Altronate dehydratase [[Clostridium] cellulosi]